MKKFTRNQILITAGLFIMTGGSIAGAYFAGYSTTNTTDTYGHYGQNVNSSQADMVIPEASLQRIDEAVATEMSTNAKQTVKERLLYLIEEEKLAHDVYKKMYDLYGAQTFGNILKAETKHQVFVLTVLNARKIADPRSSELGVFVNQDLQKLYDSLIAKGSQSLSEAYKVGVIIEEVDIADLETDLKAVPSSDNDVITMMNTLKNGSENHLRAFSKHI